MHALKERIKDRSYLENFVSLAKEFAPDGERVNLVGLTFNKAGREVPVELTTPKIGYREVVASIAEVIDGGKIREDIPAREALVGTLFAADSNSDEVKLLVDGKRIRIKVPEGLAEIVRKYFDMEVIVVVSHSIGDDTCRLVSVDPRDRDPQLF